MRRSQLAVLLLLAVSAQLQRNVAAQQNDEQKDREALRITGVQMVDLVKEVDALSPATPVAFVDVKPVDGPTQQDFGITLRIQNTGEDTLVMQSLATALYPALVNNALPGAPLEGSSNIQVTENMPNLDPKQEWPNPLKLTFPSTLVPLSTACDVFDVTVAMNATYLLRGVVTRKQQLVPIKLTPNCLNKDVAPPVTAATGSLLVQITSNVEYAQVTDTKIPFLIDFGEKVLEEDPLGLFNVTGSNRTDLVYEVEEGKIYLMVYPDDEDKATTITVSVPPSQTTNAAGVPNGAASYSVEYVPSDGVIKSTALVLTAIFAGVLVASWTTSFIVSCMQPWATAGSLGYGALGFILWAQKLQMTGMLTTTTLPANYRTLAEAFNWANFHADLPWNFNSDESTNLTSSVSQFEPMAVVAIDNAATLLYYDGPDTDPNVFNSTTEPSAAPGGGSTGTATGSGPAMAPAPSDAAPVPSAPVPVPQAQPVLPPPNTPAVPVTLDGSVPAGAPGVDMVPAAPDSCSVFPNTDFFQGDLNDTSFPTSDPNACCSACLANPDCYVWTLHAVLSKCYLKASKGWLQRSNMTCCISGTANRNGLSSILPGGVEGAAPAGAEGGKNNNNGGNNNNNNNDGGNNNNNNNNNDRNNNNNNRRLLLRLLQQNNNNQATATPSPVGGAAQQQQQASIVASVNKRYVLLSMGPTTKSAAQASITVANLDAWDKARDIVYAADPEATNDDDDNVYVPLEEVGFWFGVVFALACLFNLTAWMFVNCCEGELPGVLHLPRMQVMVIMFALSAFALEGAFLFSGGHDVVPLAVGIAVVVCIPLLFLVAAYGGIAAALYRKRKAVYLVSRVSIEEEMPHNKWDLQVVAKWMGMSLNRGKWRPSDPSKKNQFVFRWGPLFEDCRGPLFTRRKSSPSPPGASTMRRMPYSTASDVSSTSGYNPPDAMERSMRSSSRRKVSSVEEVPIANCCGHKVRRSGFQAFGVIVSLLRMVGYGLIIGGLQDFPDIQAIVLLVVSVVYMGYLRLVVPYSRRDEMALEYFVALMDIILFTLILVLALVVDDSDSSTIDSMAIGLIVVQLIGYCCYLINRLLIIVHAFAEVVCPGCACHGAPSPKKSRSRRSTSSRRMQRDMSMTSEAGMAPGGLYHVDGKYYMDDGLVKHDMDSASEQPLYIMDESGQMVPAVPMHNGMNGMDRAPSRSARAGVALMFPAIAEETDSQTGTPQQPGRSYSRGGDASFSPNNRELEKESPTHAAVQSYPVGGPSPQVNRAPSTSSSRASRQQAAQKQQADGTKAGVWDKFWKSL